MGRFSSCAFIPGMVLATGILTVSLVLDPASSPGGPFMDVRTANKPASSRWWLAMIAGLGVLGSVIMLWHYQVDYQTRQRLQAAEREARLAAFRAEAEAKQLEAERQAARIKSRERVGSSIAKLTI